MNDMVEELLKKLNNFSNIDRDELNNVINQTKKLKISKEFLKETEIHKKIGDIMKFYKNKEVYKNLVDKCNKIRNVWKKKLREEKNKTLDNEILNNKFEEIKNEIKEETKEEISKEIIPNKLIFKLELDNSTRYYSAKQIFDKLKEIINKNDKLVDFSNNINDIAIKIESEIWTLHNGDVNNYKRYLRQRILIITNKSNPHIAEDLINGSLDVSYFVKTDLKDLIDKSLRQKEVEDKKWAMEAMQSDFYIKNSQVKEGEFECFKCKSRKILSTQKQMRSADEPMTTFFNCINCNNIWKMN